MKSAGRNLDVFLHSDAAKARAYRIAAETAAIDPYFSEAERAARVAHYTEGAKQYEARMEGRA